MASKRKEVTVNSAMAYSAFLEIQLELLEELTKTNLFSGKAKNATRVLSKHTYDKLLGLRSVGLYNNDDAELQKQHLSKLVENFVYIIKNSDYVKISQFINALENFKDGIFVNK